MMEPPPFSIILGTVSRRMRTADRTLISTIFITAASVTLREGPCSRFVAPLLTTTSTVPNRFSVSAIADSIESGLPMWHWMGSVLPGREANSSAVL